MARQIKEVVSKEETFDKLEIRLGRIIAVEEEPSAPKKAYRMKIDFGKFGIRTSVGRFTNHSLEDMKNTLVFGVLNFEPRQVGDVISEALILGVQYPKVESGEATLITPVVNAKIGGKIF
jgi:tRNA-binding protein